MKRVFSVVVLVLLVNGVHGQPKPLVETILAANHAAVGKLPTSATVVRNYTCTDSGLTGPATLRFDLATGAYMRERDASGVHDADGFDGKTPWQQDISLAYTEQLGGDRVPVAVSYAYRNANLWWRADRGGAQITFLGRETVDGDAQDHLSVVPHGGRRFEAWFDASNHLLTRIAEDRQFFHYHELYSEYRAERGIQVAHKLVTDSGLGPESEQICVLKNVRLAPTAGLNTYAMPDDRPAGASIDGGAASTSVPFRLLNNHVYVEATVNGKGPFTFIVDTGGHTLLSPKLVKQVGLSTVGEAVTSGAGEGHSTTGFVHFDEIAIGAARLRSQMGFATNIYDTSIEGIPVDGMVGFELIRRMVTTIDYGRNIIIFTDPARFKPKTDLGDTIPFVFYDHLPFVSGEIAGIPAHFDIDTGSRSEVDVTSPFVRAHNLRAQFPEGSTVVDGWGVGGPSKAYIVRLPELRLGNVAISQVPAGLSEDRGGSISDPSYDGNIGSALLKRFVVTFDYDRQKLYLRRIQPQPADVGTFDRSGLWLNAQGGGFTVMDVAENSAGAVAGLQVGEVITAVDGRPAAAGELAEVRRMLRVGPVGHRVELTVRRQESQRTVLLVLKDQI